jgi:toxin ParE1/3/4
VTAKPVTLRRRAREDVDDAVEHYVTGAGSPRYAHELDLPGLRAAGPRRFPYLVFHVDQPDHIDVWRMLQAQRDLPTWLEPDGVRR